MKDIWNKLTPFSKDFYDNDIKELTNTIEKNLLYSGIYHIIDGVFMLILFGIISNMEGNMTGQWRPRTHVINPGCETKGNLINEMRRRLKR